MNDFDYSDEQENDELESYESENEDNENEEVDILSLDELDEDEAEPSLDYNSDWDDIYDDMDSDYWDKNYHDKEDSRNSKDPWALN